MATCVKLRGLPWSVTNEELIQFFSPIPVANESISLLYNYEGRPSGECFVWFQERHLDEALALNRNRIGSRYIEVFASDEDEYSHAMSKSGEKMQTDVNGNPLENQEAQSSVIRVRGLPFRCTPEEVAQVFSVTADEVIIALNTTGNRQGEPSGDCFIRFNTVGGAQKALNTMQGCSMGPRYLELFASTESAIDALVSAGGTREVGRGACRSEVVQDLNPQENREGSGWLRLRGLPYQATAQDIVEFASEAIALCESDITIKYQSDGRPSGEAFIQLESEDTVADVQSILDRKNMGSRFIEVFASSYDDAQAIRHNRSGPYSRGPREGRQEWGSYGKVRGGVESYRNESKGQGKGMRQTVVSAPRVGHMRQTIVSAPRVGQSAPKGKGKGRW